MSHRKSKGQEKQNRVPVIGPGSGKELFEEIESWDFWPKDQVASGIENCDFESLQECANALWMSSPFRWQPCEGPFSFLASSSMGGAGNPTFDFPCRLGRALDLGRFAALYADTVLIRDPFEEVLYGEDSEKTRAGMTATLLTLLALRPQIEAGVIAFAPTTFPLCEEALTHFRRVEDEYREQVFAANSLLIDKIVRDANVSIEAKSNYKYVSIGGVGRYVNKDQIDLVNLPRSEGGWNDRDGLQLDEIHDLIQTFVADPSLVDLQYRNIIRWLYNVRYLTDRPLDSMLLDLLDNIDKSVPKRFGPQLTHKLPFIDGLDTEALIKLRAEEGEAFQVYRERVKSLVEDRSDTETFEEAFDDLVRPQLASIDRAVANAKTIARRQVREKLVFGTGMVTIGLAAGFIVPAAGAIVSAFGGAKFGTDLLSSLNDLVSEPKELRQNDFYFLWRARQLSNKTLRKQSIQT